MKYCISTTVDTSAHLELLLISTPTSPPKISCSLCWLPSCVIETAHACLQNLCLEGLKSTRNTFGGFSLVSLKWQYSQPHASWLQQFSFCSPPHLYESFTEFRIWTFTDHEDSFAFFISSRGRLLGVQGVQSSLSRPSSRISW